MKVADKHQLRIAHQTLRMTDAGARIMGGMTKQEALAIIERLRNKKHGKETRTTTPHKRRGKNNRS